MPARRPRCCFLYLTFFGINMTKASSGRLRRSAAALLFEEIPLVDPDLDPDHAVGRPGLRGAVVDVGLQGMERQTPLLVPLGPRDLSAAQPAAHHDLDPL